MGHFRIHLSGILIYGLSNRRPVVPSRVAASTALAYQETVYAMYLSNRGESALRANAAEQSLYARLSNRIIENLEDLFAVYQIARNPAEFANAIFENINLPLVIGNSIQQSQVEAVLGLLSAP